MGFFSKPKGDPLREPGVERNRRGLVQRLSDAWGDFRKESRPECPQCGVARLHTPYGFACPRCDLRREEGALDVARPLPEPLPEPEPEPAPAPVAAEPVPAEPASEPAGGDPEERAWGPPPGWRKHQAAEAEP